MKEEGKDRGTSTDSAVPGPRSAAWSRRRFVQGTTAGVVVVLGSSSMTTARAADTAASQCTARETGGPLQITADCADPLYGKPVIDSEQDVTEPVPHHKVSGHFDGTDKKFTFCLPPKKQWQGRFFQKVYPEYDENPSATDIAFGADSGAYTVQTNGGGGYRVDAAAAKFSRTVAAEYYGSSRRIHGYLYGGSGGSYQTIGAMENTRGVWDGAVPFIPGTPASIPNSFTVRAMARLVLAEKGPQIAAAVTPGSDSDPYAGLDEVERDMLLEITRMGVPLRAWEDHEYVLGMSAADGLLGFTEALRSMDPTYADDFWGEPGYLGTEQSALGDIFRAARIDHTATIVKVHRDARNVPTGLVLDSVPANDSSEGLTHTVYDAAGTTAAGTVSGVLDRATRTLTLDGGTSAEVLDAIGTGRGLRTDNRWTLAFRAYHRYQVPERPGFYTYDQYLGRDGQPLYPQRDVQVGPLISTGVSDGGTHTGKIGGKVIVVANLLDSDACPWPGDWYRSRVREALGERRLDEMFRLYYNDCADHQEGAVTGTRAARLVEFNGMLQHALRELSDWVEKGVSPAHSTAYTVSADNQIKVPSTARTRLGIQPVVRLTADGTDHVRVTAGRPVTLRGTIQLPPGAGRIVSTEWDFAGQGTFAERPFGPGGRSVEVRATFTYTEPGTYFPALRATTQREGREDSPFARVQNLGRVRVVVT
ncbi:PKD domain-containing protein [Streptomyces sp. JW3]|uniref:PKD domain-containing protein n=1 Tax=Streptomyces sp. JW3 TaxID=3456955 RepID=UPI003FA438CE